MTTTITEGTETEGTETATEGTETETAKGTEAILMSTSVRTRVTAVAIEREGSSDGGGEAIEREGGDVAQVDTLHVLTKMPLYPLLRSMSAMWREYESYSPVGLLVGLRCSTIGMGRRWQSLLGAHGLEDLEDGVGR